MKLAVINHSYRYEMEKLVRIFMPGEKIEVTDSKDGCELVTAVGGEISVSAAFENFNKTLTAPLCADNEMQMGRMVYRILSEYTGFYPPWGVLTGVRPSKLLISTQKKLGEGGAEKYFKEELLVSGEKYELAKSVAAAEKKIIESSKPMSYSLYVSIPFCPSRCSYCSFVSHSIENEKAASVLPEYTEKLKTEIEQTGKIAEKLGLCLESVYIGGGTPTTLSAESLSVVLNTVKNSVDLSSCREFTVEAGRPDTITAEKLTAIKESPADRISINPQTFSDKVLANIGRRHTSAQTEKAYFLAREIGFGNINMDLIAGLPGDTPESFEHSLNRACELDPENITVHTLAVKRASGIGLNSPETAAMNASNARKMLDYAYKKLSGKYSPYYMYRQSNSASSLENTGWSKAGFECVYNVFMMEECHTVLACGGGAVTKLKAYNSGVIERIFNFKYPFEYISDFDELLARKKRITEFYRTYF